MSTWDDDSVRRSGPEYTLSVAAHAKNTTDTLTMTSNDRHTMTHTEFTTELIQLDRQCNRTKARKIAQKGKNKRLRFAFLIPIIIGTARAFDTFAKPHKPSRNPRFAKKPNFVSVLKKSVLNFFKFIK